LHWALFGALTVQLYFYYQAFPNDRAHVKSVIYTMYILEIMQTALITHDPVVYLGLAYDNPAVWAETGGILSRYSAQLVGSLTGQFFYAHRLHMLSNSCIIPVIIALISIVSSTGGFLDGKYLFEVFDTYIRVYKDNPVSVPQPNSLGTSYGWPSPH
ncbi:hypothetical protein R3P38DRAFT_3574549, partial [Favolaschia claudopus]